MRKTLILAAIFVTPGIVSHAMGSVWPTDLGAHRAVVHVPIYAPAVYAIIPFDAPEVSGLTVVDAATGKEAPDAIRLPEKIAPGAVIFEPVTGAGDYYIYYRVPYPKPLSADRLWVKSNKLSAADLSEGRWRNLPEAEFEGMESASDFDKFSAMEKLASEDQINELVQKFAERPYLVFAEDRRNPVRTTRGLPRDWVNRGPSDSFSGIANRDEYYPFQICIYATQQQLQDIAINCGDMHSDWGDEKAVIPSSAFVCLSKNGIDCHGKPFTNPLTVDKGALLPIWFGLQVPRELPAGMYTGTIRVEPGTLHPTEVKFHLKVCGPALEDHGDSDAWRLSRLRWLNSTVANDDRPTEPYVPMETGSDSVKCLGREIQIGNAGLPNAIRSYFSPDNFKITSQPRDVLGGPIRFVARTGNSATFFEGKQFKFVEKTHSAVAWESDSSAGALSMHCRGKMEFDGFVLYSIDVVANEKTDVKDVSLEIPINKQAAIYMMGLGRKGGFRPRELDWKWDQATDQDCVWIGDVNAGVRCKFYDENYRRPLSNIYYSIQPLNLPPSWYNNNSGGIHIGDEPGQSCVIRAFTGEFSAEPNKPLHLDFSLLLTPLKTIDISKHWAGRYYHIPPPANPTVDEVVAAGANVVNMHQGPPTNPYINYPFLTADAIKSYVAAMHDKGVKVKLYYTLRELTTRCSEIWALRALPDRIYMDGAPDTGQVWLRDHLHDHYIPAWTAVLADGSLDTSILTTTESRLHNFYVQGLDWMVRNLNIDGIYIDDAAYDRTISRRVRKVLDDDRPGSLVDMHSWNHFQERAGFGNCINLYMENLPYIDRLWLGEDFDYGGQPPDYWLVEISGIPFGLMGDMIGGNQWRGPVFGMISRLGWAGGDPRPIWKLWDQFGIADAQMIGYWLPDCPVQVDSPDVKATVYRKPHESLIALASWAGHPAACHLQIDWKALGIDPSHARLRAPAVENFQQESTFDPNAEIRFDRGVMLILDETP